METFEIIATIRMFVASDSATAAEELATSILNDIAGDIEHIEVK